MIIRINKHGQALIEGMEERAKPLRELAVESASVDGLHGLADAFTSVASAQLRADCDHFIEQSPSITALAEQEEALMKQKTELESMVAIYRARYETATAEEHLVPGNSRRRMLSLALLAVFAGLCLWAAGLVREVPGLAMVACAGLLLMLNHNRIGCWVSHLRDFMQYRRVASRLAGLRRSLEQNRAELLGSIARRDWADQWIQHQSDVLASLYKLYRGRAERAAILTQS